MTQDECWLARNDEEMDFIVVNKKPSKHYAEERNMHNFVKKRRRMINAWVMNEPRLGMFK